MKYYQLKDGEWFRPLMKGFRDACCDCGLVHTTDFRISNGYVEFRSRRNNRATAAIRRTKKRP